MKRIAILFMAAVGMAALTKNAAAQSHGHLNVGAVGVNQNDQLTFDNGADFSTNIGYIKTLNYASSGTYVGYYAGNITLTALAETPAFGGPVPNAPALGSQIWAQIVSVDGPVGGTFSFWNSGAITPTISLACGTTGTNTFILSQNDGSPGSDPYGHIHGRQFTATKPGIYLVGFRAIDLSTNGINGGPIHTPSDVLKFYFQAGVNIASANKSGSGCDVTMGTPLGSTLYLESATSLTQTNWTQVGSVAGNDALQTISDPDATASQKFYRVRVTTP